MRYRASIDRLSAGRLFPQFGHVHVAEICQHQRARDRRGAQDQHIHSVALGGQRQAFTHAKTVLFVHDRQRQHLEHDIVLYQGVGPDEQIDVTTCSTRDDLAPLLAFLTAGQDGYPQTCAFGERRDGLDVLTSQDFGRRHKHGLLSDLGHSRGRQ